MPESGWRRLCGALLVWRVWFQWCRGLPFGLRLQLLIRSVGSYRGCSMRLGRPKEHLQLSEAPGVRLDFRLAISQSVGGALVARTLRATPIGRGDTSANPLQPPSVRDRRR